jgi:hypothetical protein
MLEAFNRTLTDLLGPLGPLIAVGVPGCPAGHRCRAAHVFLQAQAGSAGQAARTGAGQRRRSAARRCMARRIAPPPRDSATSLPTYSRASSSRRTPRNSRPTSSSSLQAGYRGKNAVRSFHFFAIRACRGPADRRASCYALVKVDDRASPRPRITPSLILQCRRSPAISCRATGSQSAIEQRQTGDRERLSRQRST